MLWTVSTIKISAQRQWFLFTNSATFFRVKTRPEQQRNSSSPTKPQKGKLVGKRKRTNHLLDANDQLKDQLER